MTFINQIIKKKNDIILKLWQVNVIVDIMYNKKDIVILTSTRFDKIPLYQLIFFIKDRVILLMVLPTIAFMSDQIC